MYLDNETKLDFQDVLIRPKRSTLTSRSQVDLIRVFKTKHGAEFSGIPIIASNMVTGTFSMLDALAENKMFTAIAKHHNKVWYDLFSVESGNSTIGTSLRTQILNYGLYTLGLNYTELDELSKLANIFKEDKNKLKICIDIANGYTQRFAAFVTMVRDKFPTNVIIAGNVATPEMVQELVIAGADFIKIGIGPGRGCTTRLKTGVGYPQISASIEGADAAHGLGAGIVLDGGMRSPGDVCKAFCANADLVMAGSLFAGTDECEGDIISRTFISDEVEWNNAHYESKYVTKKYKLFYGMSSEYAQEKHFGGKKEYRTSEGSVEEIEYKGPVQNTVNDILGGLRSCGTYIGAPSIKNFGKCATFIKVSRQHDRF